MPGLEGGPTYPILRTSDGEPHLFAFLDGEPDWNGSTTMCGKTGTREDIPNLTVLIMCPDCLAIAHPEDQT